MTGSKQDLFKLLTSDCNLYNGWICQSSFWDVYQFIIHCLITDSRSYFVSFNPFYGRICNVSQTQSIQQAHSKQARYNLRWWQIPLTNIKTNGKLRGWSTVSFEGHCRHFSFQAGTKLQNNWFFIISCFALKFKGKYNY